MGLGTDWGHSWARLHRAPARPQPTAGLPGMSPRCPTNHKPPALSLQLVLALALGPLWPWAPSEGPFHAVSTDSSLREPSASGRPTG